MKYFLTLALGFIGTVSFAQNIFPQPGPGNVGIGTTTPTTKLDVITTANLNGSTLTNLAYFGQRTSSGNTGLFIQHIGYGITTPGEPFPTLNTYRATKLSSVAVDVPKSYLEFDTPLTTNTTRAALSFGFGTTELMRINQDGKVRISNGTTDLKTPPGYRLFVEEGILTEKVKVAVKTTANWADYVFADNYNLMPLEEVEKFTKENKHLPNLPSAQKMVEEGLDVATMDAKLLEKIEELTLYLIEQNKQFESYKAEQSKIKAEQNETIETLKAEVKSLKEKQ